MAEFNVGDKVIAQKGSTTIGGVLRAGHYNDGHRYVGESGRSVTGLTRDGFTLEVIERAPVPVPVEPGRYLDTAGDQWTLHRNGEWFHNGDGSLAVQWTVGEMRADLQRRLLPFTRLVQEDTERVARLKVVPRLKQVAEDLTPYEGISTTTDVSHARAVVSNLIGELQL